MLNRRAFSDVLAETPKHSRLKEDARQIEFVRIGQVSIVLNNSFPYIINKKNKF